MSKLNIYLAVTTGSLAVFADLPIYFVFGIVFVAAMIEAKKIEKKVYPIISNLISSSVTGWGASFGVKHFYPELFETDTRIFIMLLTTVFAYSIIVFLLKNDTLGSSIANLLKKNKQI